MQFITLATLFTAALASPLSSRGVSTEVVSTDNAVFSRDDSDTLSKITFTLHSETSGDDINCASGAYPTDGGDLYTCSTDSSYSFRLAKHTYAGFTITVYHATSQAAGLEGNLTMTCNGSNSFDCQERGTATTTLCSDLTVCGSEAN